MLFIIEVVIELIIEVHWYRAAEILSRQEIFLLDTPKSGSVPSLQNLYIAKLCILVVVATPDICTPSAKKSQKAKACIVAGEISAGEVQD